MTLHRRIEPQIPEDLTVDLAMAFMPPATDTPGKLEPKHYEFFQHCADIPFEEEACGFSATIAWYLSECSYLAYAIGETEAQVEDLISPALRRMLGDQVQVKVFLGSPHRDLEASPKDGIQCFVAHGDRLGVVAFRGTVPNSPSNWITDLESLPVTECSNGSIDVHDGFKEALDCLWLEASDAGLAHYLARLRETLPGLNWWFTGHSLGAALATLSASRFEHPLGLYTFGSPRVGNRAFVERLREKLAIHYRVVNHRDLVTQVPFLPPFKHAGQAIYLEEQLTFEPGMVHFLDHLPLSAELREQFDNDLRGLFDPFNRLRLHLQADGLARALLDHAPIFYSKLLWNRMVTERTR